MSQSTSPLPLLRSGLRTLPLYLPTERTKEEPKEFSRTSLAEEREWTEEAGRYRQERKRRKERRKNRPKSPPVQHSTVNRLLIFQLSIFSSSKSKETAAVENSTLCNKTRPLRKGGSSRREREREREDIKRRDVYGARREGDASTGQEEGTPIHPLPFFAHRGDFSAGQFSQDKRSCRRRERGKKKVATEREREAAPYSHVDTPVPVRSLKLSKVGSG